MLTVTEASKRLNVCEGTVRRYIREGKLAAIKNDETRAVRIDENVLDAYIASSWRAHPASSKDAADEQADE